MLLIPTWTRLVLLAGSMQGTGMVVGRTQVFLPQIGMGIQLQIRSDPG